MVFLSNLLEGSDYGLKRLAPPFDGCGSPRSLQLEEPEQGGGFVDLRPIMHQVKRVHQRGIPARAGPQAVGRRVFIRPVGARKLYPPDVSLCLVESGPIELNVGAEDFDGSGMVASVD